MKKIKETDVDRLAQIVAKGFAETTVRLDSLTTEVFRLGAKIEDTQNFIKSHQEMLVDHEQRLVMLES